MQKIIANIDPKGAVDYQVEGVKGKGCKDLTKFIDNLGQVSETKATGEMYETDTEQETVRE